MSIDLTHAHEGPYRVIPLPDGMPGRGWRQCVFCRTQTRFAHERTGNAVCPECASFGRYGVKDLRPRAGRLRGWFDRMAAKGVAEPTVRLPLHERERSVIRPGRWPLRDGTVLAKGCPEGWLAWVAATRGLLDPASLYLTPARAQGAQDWLYYLIRDNPDRLSLAALSTLNGLRNRIKIQADDSGAPPSTPAISG